eukprot:SAG31_NODE_4381_length_3286_cov_2.039536_2_plen_207_part_01
MGCGASCRRSSAARSEGSWPAWPSSSAASSPTCEAMPRPISGGGGGGGGAERHPSSIQQSIGTFTYDRGVFELLEAGVRSFLALLDGVATGMPTLPPPPPLPPARPLSAAGLHPPPRTRTPPPPLSCAVEDQEMRDRRWPLDEWQHDRVPHFPRIMVCTARNGRTGADGSAPALRGTQPHQSASPQPLWRSETALRFVSSPGSPARP